MITAQRDEKQTQIEQVRKERLALETEKVQITVQIESIKTQLRSLMDEGEKIETSIKDLQNESIIATKTIADLEAVAQEKVQALQGVLDHQEELANRLNDIKVEKDGVDQHLGRLETNQAKIQARLDVLDQAEAALSGYSEGSKTIMENSRQGHLPAGIEPLSKHFIVDGKFEKAIGAALGELTDLLVVPPAGKNAVIEYLVSKNKDRVALISLEARMA